MSIPRTWWILFAILLSATALRWLYLAEIAQKPEFTRPEIDAGYHDYWARGLATGEWVRESHFDDPLILSTPYFRPPGYPFFLSAIYRLAGTGYLAPRIAQMALGVINCFLLFHVVRRWYGDGTGLIAAGFMAVYWVFIYFEGELLEPAITITLSLLLLHILASWIDGMSWARCTLAGVLVGLFALVRPNVLPFAVAVMAWSLWIFARKKILPTWMKGIGVFAIAMLVTIAPATFRNYRVSGELVVVSCNGGINLFFGNNEFSNGFTPSHPETGSWSCFDYPHIVSALSSRLGRDLTYTEASSHFAQRAWTYVAHHPIDAALLTIQKAQLFWGPLEVRNEKELELEKDASTILRGLPIRFPLLLSIGLLGMFLSACPAPALERANYHDRRDRKAFAVLLILFVLVYSLTYLPFLAAGRYRAPIAPVLIIFASSAVTYLIGLARSKQYTPFFTWLFAGCGLFALAQTNFAGYEPSEARWNYDRGLAHARAGELEQAADLFMASVTAKPDYTEAYANLGFALVQLGRITEALKAYQAAIELDPENAVAFNNIGDLYMRQGQPEQAAPYFERAMQLKPGYAKAISNLGHSLAQRGRFDEAASHFEHVVLLQPDGVEAIQVLAHTQLAAGQTQMALSSFARVLKERHDDLDTLNAVAWVRATNPDPDIRDGRTALQLAIRANELSRYENPLYLDTLAAAQAETTDYESAAATARSAIRIAEAAHAVQFLEGFESRLRLYEKRQPYRDALKPSKGL